MDLDNESLRERLDVAVGKAEDAGQAVRTLDAMLGEPQVVIPVDEFGERLYAIIKEDTVVTVLPRSVGEEILERGQALMHKVASREIQMAGHELQQDRWSARRPWQREPIGPVVIRRASVRREDPEPSRASMGSELKRSAAFRTTDASIHNASTSHRPDDPVGAALWDALERGSRRAAITALCELLRDTDRDDDLLPVWNEITALGIPQGLKLGDLMDAFAAMAE